MKRNELQKRILAVLKKVSKENNNNNKEVDDLITELQNISNLESNYSQVEEQLLTSELNLKSLINNKDESIWSIDSNYNYIIFNDYFKKQYYTAYKIKLKVGLNALDILTNDSCDFWKEKYDIALSGKKNIFEFEVKVGKDMRCFKVSLNPIKSSKKVTGVSALSVDITKRKEDELKVRKSEENYRNLLQLAPNAFLQGNLEGMIIDCNEAAAKLTGYKCEELLEMNISDFFGKDTLDENPLRYDLLEKCETVSTDRELIRKNGKFVTIEMSSKKMDDGTIQAFMRDITKRKKLIKSLRESKVKYQLVAEKASDVVWLMNLNGKNTFVTPSIEKFTGFTQEEYLKHTLNKMLTEESAKVAKISFTKEIIKYKTRKNRKEPSKKIILDYKCKDGSIKTGEVLVTPYYNEKGQLDGIHGVTRDITARIESDIALRESEELFRNLTQSTASAVFVYQDDKFVFVNKSTEILSGYTEKELLGMNFWDIVHPDSIELVKQRSKDRKKGKKVERRCELKLIKKDKSVAWIDFTGGAINWEGKKAGIGSAFNITKSKSTERKLLKNEERYHAISDSTSDYGFTARILENGKSQMDWVGGSYKKITGYNFNEFVSKGFWASLLHPSDVVVDTVALEELLDNRKIEIEVRIFNKKGETLWIRCSAKPVWCEKEKRVVSIHGAVKDITEEKHQELVREIQYNIANAVIEVDNESDLFSIVKKELVKLIDAEHFFVAYYNKDQDVFKAAIDNDIEKVTEWKAEKSITGLVIKTKKNLFIKKKEILELKKSKKIKILGNIPEVWLGVPLIIAGKVIGAFVVQSYNNTNAYDKLSRELIVSIASQLSLFIGSNRTTEISSKLLKVIFQSPVSVMITNPKGEIEYINPKFEKVTGYTFDEIIGENPRILKSDHHTKEFYKNLWDTILAGDIWQEDVLNKKKNGTLFWENVVISPIVDDKGEITSFISHKEDISEKKEMFDETIAAKNRAEKSEKMKKNFLTQITHEIRTPVFLISSNAEYVKDELNDIMSDDIKSSFGMISLASSRLIRTIDLIVLSTDLQLQNHIPYPTKVDVLSVIEQVKKKNIQLEENRRVKYSFRLDFKRKTIISDEDALFRIIDNIIDNAIKFTELGYVKLVAKEGINKELIIIIKDTGIGMSKDFIPKLYETFTQEKEGRTRDYDGTGLGMFVAKGLCDSIKADISVKSKKGTGTTFILKIPNLRFT